MAKGLYIKEKAMLDGAAGRGGGIGSPKENTNNLDKAYLCLIENKPVHGFSDIHMPWGSKLFEEYTFP